MTPTAHLVLESEFHSGEPCDCYPPDRDRSAPECAAWAREIIHALDLAGYAVVLRDASQPADALVPASSGSLSPRAESAE